MYGYIYKTTNLINGKIYIGQHKAENFDASYYGSGKILKKALKKYGIESFSVELLCWADTKDHIDNLEQHFIKYYNSRDSKVGYNIAFGGDGGDLVSCLSDEERDNFRKKIATLNRLGIVGNKGKKLSDEHRRKIGEGNKGKVHSEEWKKKHDDAIRGKPAWNRGLTKNDPRVAKYARKKGEFKHTEETKKLISEKLKGVKKSNFSNPEQRLKNMSDAQKNRTRSEQEKERLRRIAVGRIWVHNEKECKMIYPIELDNYIKNGYVKGRGKIK